MLNQMNEYSVYYCGYSYYFLENNGELRKQININVAQDYDTAPYFKSNQTFTDKISRLEQDKIEITDNTEVDKNLTVDGDINLKNGLTVSGNTTVEDLTVNKNGMVTGTLTVENLNIGTKALIDMIYPIGSLYWSSKNINPNSLFGGTWEQIKDKFVLAAGDTYSNGTTGGSASVTLTVANMPSHNHSFNGTTSNNGAHKHGQNIQCSDGDGWDNVNDRAQGPMVSHTKKTYSSLGMPDIQNGYEVDLGGGFWNQEATRVFTSTVNGHTHTFSGTTSSSGSGTAFSILPPYIVKYCWERIA